MSVESLSDSELLVLGLVAEMPRHGYELEQVIAQRGMREWTQIGFSSIYFVLSKLEKKRLIKSATPEKPKAKKRYKLTSAGENALVSQTLTAINTYKPNHSSLLMGMLHWPVLTKPQALSTLQTRLNAVNDEIHATKNLGRLKGE